MKNAPEKLGRVWTHTTGVIAVIAAVVTIIGFFGIHPRSTVAAPQAPASPKAEQKPPADNEDRAARETTTPTVDSSKVRPKPTGAGTFHLEGGFIPGQPMLADGALFNADSTAALIDPRSMKRELVQNALIMGPAATQQPVSIWRRGSRFVKGIRLTSNFPHIHVGGDGIESADIPTDADGTLSVNVIWPTSKPFTTVEFVGPVEIRGLRLTGGITLVNTTGDSNGICPVHLSLDFPKPGEILGALKGDCVYSVSPKPRSVVIQALSAPNQPAATWTAECGTSGSASFRDTRSGVFDAQLFGLTITLRR